MAHVAITSGQGLGAYLASISQVLDASLDDLLATPLPSSPNKNGTSGGQERKANSPGDGNQDQGHPQPQAEAGSEVGVDGPDPLLRRCGLAALTLLRDDPRAALKLADAKLHVFPFKDVDACWRRLYVEASVRVAVEECLAARGDGGPGKSRGRNGHGVGGVSIGHDDVIFQRAATPVAVGEGARDTIKLKHSEEKPLLDQSRNHDRVHDEAEDEATAIGTATDWLDRVVRLLDMALIMAGGTGREEMIGLD